MLSSSEAHILFIQESTLATWNTTNPFHDRLLPLAVHSSATGRAFCIFVLGAHCWIHSIGP